MSEYNDIFYRVLQLEADALLRAIQQIPATHITKLVSMFDSLMERQGQMICMGVGKSGHIARKMAATFSSLGLNASFLHPVEALHGDMGRVRGGDLLVILSKSGTTEEIIKFLAYSDLPQEQIIGLLGNPRASLATKCALVLDCSVEQEACLNNQAPTTSSTLTLAIGDAMAVVYEKLAGLTKEGFARNHPAGALGKSLRLKVRDLMQDFGDSAIVREDGRLKDVVLEMSAHPVGACAILDSNDFLVGLVVEGDFRRSLNRGNLTLESDVQDIMNRTPITIGPDELAYDALVKMESGQKQIYVLPVVEQHKFLGFIRMHDIMREGLYAR